MTNLLTPKNLLDSMNGRMGDLQNWFALFGEEIKPLYQPGTNPLLLSFPVLLQPPHWLGYLGFLKLPFYSTRK